MKRPSLRPLAALLLIAGHGQCALGMPSFDAVKSDFRPSDTLFLDRQGEVVQRLRTDAAVRRGQWVPLADVSPALRQAPIQWMAPVGQVLTQAGSMPAVTRSLHMSHLEMRLVTGSWRRPVIRSTMNPVSMNPQSL